MSVVARNARTALARLDTSAAADASVPVLQRRKKRNAKRLSLNKLREQDVELPEILFESEGLLGVTKPASYAIQGDHRRANSGKWYEFMRLLQAQYGKLFAVDRLDAYTSGAYLFARNRKQSQRISELLERNRIPKTFLAIVYGSLEARKQWQEAPDVMLQDASVGKRISGWLRVDEQETRKASEGTPGAKEFMIDASIIQSSSDDRFHLLRIEPRTSIKHGIRAQLALQLKTPVIGDYKYADIAQRKTFDYLKYQGSFALALHCLDLTVPTFHNVPGETRLRLMQGIYGHPSELFEATLRKCGLDALEQGLVRFGGPRGLFKPDVLDIRALPNATSSAVSGAARSRTSAPALGTQDMSLVTQSRNKVETGLTALDKDERDRLRRTFDPERRAREAFDTSKMPAAPIKVTHTTPRPYDAKLSNEMAAVDSQRMAAGRLLGMIELRRRRQAAKRAVERGESPNKLKRPAGNAIRKRPRLGMSTEYAAQSRAPSPKAVRRRQAEQVAAQQRKKLRHIPGHAFGSRTPRRLMAR